MTAAGYERLGIEEFGAQLLSSGDLDPVYIGLRSLRLDDEAEARWLIAYWCFYHVGAACCLSEITHPQAFWEGMIRAAQNDTPTPLGTRWPRAAERRHFRGRQALDSVQALREQFPDPLQLIGYLTGWDEFGGPLKFDDVEERALRLRGFGPWIAFKMADMIDRCTGIRVEFPASVLMYRVPREGALLSWAHCTGRPAWDPDEAVREEVVRLLAHFRSFTAPPGHERQVGVQEVETILCKWKSHVNGHYPVGKDTREVREALLLWSPVSARARKMLVGSPVEMTS